MSVVVPAMGGHGGPPLQLLPAHINTLAVNVGVALRGHPLVGVLVQSHVTNFPSNKNLLARLHSSLVYVHLAGPTK